jgi:hypothetical protein
MATISWAIRVTFANGQTAFLRHGGVIGKGAIVSFHSKAKADAEAENVRNGLNEGDVLTVIMRSHGRHAARPDPQQEHP